MSREKEAFELHPQLAKDCFFLKDLGICRALMMNDKRLIWVVLVPRVANAIEWHDLDSETAALVFDETMKISKSLKNHFKCDKINIGAIGNIVPQLHIHIIARFENDACWPAPVWGSTRIEYDDAGESLKTMKALF